MFGTYRDIFRVGLSAQIKRQHPESRLVEAQTETDTFFSTASTDGLNKHAAKTHQESQSADRICFAKR